MARIVSLDVGHSNTRVMTVDGIESFPSLASESFISPEEVESPTYGRELPYRLCQPSHWLVGDLAKEQRGAEPSTAPDWPLTESYRALVRTALSLATKSFHIQLFIFQSLPAQSMAFKEDVEAFLLGKHLIEVRGKKTQTIEVLGVKTVPQGVGAFFSHHISEDGRVTGQTPGKVAVIDIGSRTCSFVGMNGFHVLEDELVSLDLGVWIVEEATRAWLDRKNPGLCKDITRAELMDYIVTGKMPYKNGDLDLSPLVDPIKKRLAEQIITQAKSMWGFAYDREVVVTGGGSLLLDGHFSQAYEHAVVLGEDAALMGNVTGQYRIGLLGARSR